MFNLKKQAQKKHIIPSNDNKRIILKYELLAHDIKPISGKYELRIGDEIVLVNSLQECEQSLKEGINELKYALFNLWQELFQICTKIHNSHQVNTSSTDNIIFLHNVKRAFLFSSLFDELKPISKNIKAIFDLDISRIAHEQIKDFNSVYLKIKLVHHMVMNEKYKLMLVKRYMQFTKEAQISGPWANLDLTMDERVWPWEEDEEYFSERSKSKKNQGRYNPESIDGTGTSGIYFVWQDLSRDPYRFEDRETDSPYKYRSLLSIP